MAAWKPSEKGESDAGWLPLVLMAALVIVMVLRIGGWVLPEPHPDPVNADPGICGRSNVGTGC